MLCTHMETVGVNGLTDMVFSVGRPVRRCVVGGWMELS